MQLESRSEVPSGAVSAKYNVNANVIVANDNVPAAQLALAA